MSINKELIKGSMTTIILKLLSQDDCYGYELIKKANHITEGAFSFKEGTLYPILHNLEEQQIIQSYWQQADGERKRKYYTITDIGLSVLAEKKVEWNFFQNMMEKILVKSSIGSV